jgi:hypothetical protein
MSLNSQLGQSVFCSNLTVGKITIHTGAIPSVTQATSKATDVTLSAISGNVVTTNSALASGALVQFVVNNLLADANDLIIANHVSGGTDGAYLIDVSGPVNGGFRINVTNRTGGSLSEAITIGFLVFKR